MLQYLEELKGRGITVNHYKKMTRERVIWTNGRPKCVYGIDHSINKYFKTHPRVNYIVTDDDIDITGIPGDVIELLTAVLKQLPKRQVARPNLRTDDIPDGYPKKELLMGHAIKHMSRGPGTRGHGEILFKGQKIPCMFLNGENQFTLFRKNYVHTGLQVMYNSVLVMGDYSARSLQWYEVPPVDECLRWYDKHRTFKSHWSLGGRR